MRNNCEIIVNSGKYVILRHFLSRAVEAPLEHTHLCNFGKVHHEEQFCGIISKINLVSGDLV